MRRAVPVPRRFVTLRLWHPDCWMLELSERHRGVTVECHAVHAHAGRVESDAVVRADGREALAAALDDVAPDGVAREVLEVGACHAEVYSSYPATRSMYGMMQDAGFLLVAPVVHRDGSELWHVLADAGQLADGVAGLRRVADVTVERVSDRKPRRAEPDGLAERVAATLTPRQREALERAVRDGYYDWPRRKDLRTLAAEARVSGPTFLEHLRRGEGRLVAGVLDAMRRSGR